MNNYQNNNPSVYMSDEDFNAVAKIMKANPDLYIEDFVKFAMATRQVAIPQFYTDGMEQHYGFENFEDMCDQVSFNGSLYHTIDDMVMEMEK